MNAQKRKVVKTFGMCRCCGEIKKFSIYVLSAEYDFHGMKETYAKILEECLNLSLSGLDGPPEKQGICQICVTQLKKVVAFREQVRACETKFRSMLGSCDLVMTDVKVPKAKKLKYQKISTPESAPKQIKTKANERPKTAVKVEPAEEKEGHTSEDAILIENIVIKKEEIEIELEDPLSSTAVDDNNDMSLAPLQVQSDRQKMNIEIEVIPNVNKVADPKDSDKPVMLMRIGPAAATKQLSSVKGVRTSKVLSQEKYENTLTIVENSFVCPFTTSFSDYFCSYCKRIFRDPTELRKHTLQHEPSAFQKCHNRRRIAQIDIERIDCRHCPQKIRDLDALRTHLKTHGVLLHPVKDEFLQFKLTEDKHTCLTCQETFDFFHALRTHMADHFGTKICKICGRKYFDLATLKLHEKSHTDSEPKDPFMCTYCGKTFAYQGNRDVHEENIHLNKAGFPCSFCDEEFSSYERRSKHLRKTHGVTRSFRCDCGKEYDTRRGLREHKRKTHLKIKNNQCKVCGKKFYQLSTLRDHMNGHSGQKKYQCDVCDRSYIYLKSLQLHKRCHFPDTMYKCTDCPATFAQKVSLKGHVKRYHTVETVESGDG